LDIDWIDTGDFTATDGLSMWGPHPSGGISYIYNDIYHRPMLEPPWLAKTTQRLTKARASLVLSWRSFDD